MLDIPDTMPLVRRDLAVTADVVRLRDVRSADLPLFYRHQLDPEAVRMAAFAARREHEFFAYWTQILRDPRVVKRTILHGRRIAGNVVGFEQAGRTLVGYWLGREHWGQGIATRALGAFLEIVSERPVYAFVAKRNRASLRVLEKCGFTIVEEGAGVPDASGEAVPELALVLESPPSVRSAQQLR
jgi:RimJ/RimL family protein N-acetyltransferase